MLFQILLLYFYLLEQYFYFNILFIKLPQTI